MMYKIKMNISFDPTKTRPTYKPTDFSNMPPEDTTKLQNIFFTKMQDRDPLMIKPVYSPQVMGKQ